MCKIKISYSAFIAIVAFCGATIFTGCGDDNSASANDDSLSSSVENSSCSSQGKSSSSKDSEKVDAGDSSNENKKAKSSSSVKGDNKSSSSKEKTLEEKLGKCEDKGQFVVRHVQDDDGNWYSCYRSEWLEGMLEVEDPEWGEEPDDQSSSSAAHEGDVLVDSRDGESYRTVYIGYQHWMAENLRYRADESDTAKAGKYGRYYSWTTAMDTAESPCAFELCKFSRVQRQGICPDGWHLPSADEWEIFIDELRKLDSDPFKVVIDEKDWGESGNNLTGFTALPTGYYSGGTRYRSFQAHFWSSSVPRAGSVYPEYASHLKITEDNIGINSIEKYVEMPVRCIENSEESELLDYLIQKEYSGAYGELLDPRDGKKYKTVVLENREWMAENLDYETPASVCGGAADSCAKYGRLYPDSEYRSVCPDGWRVPNDSDFLALRLFSGFGYVMGHYMKSTSGWVVSDSVKEVYDGNGANVWGLNILPQGVYSDSLSYQNVYEYSGFRIDYGEKNYVFYVEAKKKNGRIRERDGYYFPVRCVKE
ncbi:FISUMP domain-containing protein [uncultured Fibrobacter sp.]|uniref:FISUMP domain-containing protein n=1 Tax=uncultured Fibrobacter sp. TaxID=261512 RepID=UPI00262039AB|nr:FISUMP domain-containing protein [uncultured Fibrobacter sp.]